jgi:hypothetical protein
MLCLADRGFNGYEHWTSAQATGAQLLWRCAVNRQLPVLKSLPDGSFLSEIRPSTKPLRQDKNAVATVRVVEYGLTTAQGEQERYRLLTTLLDETQAPALELAALYHERWEVEGVFDELKTHLRQSRRVLRSKKPDLVRQEFYGWVMAHYAVRWLMHCAASEHETTPRKLSFTGSVSLVKIALPQSGAFPPRQAAIAPVLVSPVVGASGKQALRKQPRAGQSAHAPAQEFTLRQPRPISTQKSHTNP